MDILPENERVEFESRVYSNPQVGLDESSSFIEKLRQTQQANNQQITQDTYDLGTAVPSNLGGLTGGEGYWTSRYQVPQTNAAVANLRAAAQAQALNEVLADEQAMWKQRYQDTYRDYQKRQNAKANTSGTTAASTTTTVGGVEYEDTSEPGKTVARVEPSYSPMGSGTFEYKSNQDILKPEGAIDINTQFTPSFNLTPSGDIDIQRDKFGDITSLTYNGRTYSGNAAKQIYKTLQSTGTIGGRK